MGFGDFGRFGGIFIGVRGGEGGRFGGFEIRFGLLDVKKIDGGDFVWGKLVDCDLVLV